MEQIEEVKENIRKLKWELEMNENKLKKLTKADAFSNLENGKYYEMTVGEYAPYTHLVFKHNDNVHYINDYQIEIKGLLISKRDGEQDFYLFKDLRKSVFDDPIKVEELSEDKVSEIKSTILELIKAI